MKHSIKTGLFIGVTTASLLVFILQYIPLTSMIMIIILYMYAIVGVLTAYYVHKRLVKTREENPRKLQKKEKVSSNPSTRIEKYNPTLDTLNEIKATVNLVKNVIIIRKELEKLKSESAFLIGLATDRMSRKVSLYEYLVVKNASYERKES